MLSLRVSYWRPHRVPRRVLLVRVGGVKNGRLVEPLGHNLQTYGLLVPGEGGGDGYRGTLLLDSGVLGSNVVRELELIF